jgi:hypothetical protein
MPATIYIMPATRFCELRAKHRLHYVRHRKVSNKKWNHMECQDCVLLEEKLRRSSKTPALRDKCEAELKAHWEYQESFRDQYCTTIVKAIENIAFDLSMHCDAGAPDGMNYSPFYYKDISGEPAQHTCLKIHVIFIKIHGLGRIAFVTYPQLEEQSSNMIVEVILRAVLHYLRSTGKMSLRNLYIEMDNASANKSHVLVAALSVLPLLGICRKVKVSYLARGHSHCDGDGDIGTAGNYISGMDLPTFSFFAAAIKDAFKNKAGYTEVVQLIGATDYAAMFPEYAENVYKMHGLTTAHGIRIVLNDEGTEPYVTYYDDLGHGDEAWFPRPAPAHPCGNWRTIFAHPVDPLLHGYPIGGVCNPVKLKGMRQHWSYNITYVSGDEQRFVLPCTSLPFPLGRVSVIQRIRHTVRQVNELLLLLLL